jgi:GNAT superfamily N-acetyltransferase
VSSVQIERLASLDAQDLEDLFDLLRDFSHLNDQAQLETNVRVVLANPASAALVARNAGRVIGICIVTLIYKTSRIESRLDDVVVSKALRGHGIGTKLCKAAIQWAREAGADRLELTSHSKRTTANKLYHELGFRVRETNVYTMKL